VIHTLEGLSGLPNYLRTFEKDQEIKDMKIKHLENEVQRYMSSNNPVVIFFLNRGDHNQTKQQAIGTRDAATDVRATLTRHGA